MSLTGFFPVLLSRNVQHAQAFFERCFGMATRFECDWYVHLAHPTMAFEVAVMTTAHESLPPFAQTPASGVLLSFEVSDATAEHARLASIGVELVHGLRDEAWGQRHFMLRGPDGVLVDVIERIAPSPAYEAAYRSAES